jgi:hypothetical protein
MNAPKRQSTPAPPPPKPFFLFLFLAEAIAVRPPVNIGTTVRIQRFRKYEQNGAQREKNEGRQVDISSLVAWEGGGGVSHREKAMSSFRDVAHDGWLFTFTI